MSNNKITIELDRDAALRSAVLLRFVEKFTRDTLSPYFADIAAELAKTIETELFDWKPITDVKALWGDFYEIRVVIKAELGSLGVDRVVGCLGYALKAELAGESLFEPHVEYNNNERTTILCFSYDSTKSARDDAYFEAALDLAKQYIKEGIPVRKTDRAGLGTKGTRLVEGIGDCEIEFYVR